MNEEDIKQNWFNEVLSEELAHYTFSYYCKKYQQDRFAKKPSKYYDYSLQVAAIMHNNIGYKNWLNPNDKIKMDVSEKQANPEYWLNEYRSYIDCKAKLGRVPDSGMFVISKLMYDRLSYDYRIKNLINMEDVVIK